MKNIICCANPVKEILSTGDCLAAVERAVAECAGGAPPFRGFRFSDGGDGFLDAIQQTGQTQRVDVDCTAPLGDLITAPVVYAQESSTAFIESAACCGLRLMEEHRRNVMMSGTAGIADLVAAAKAHGAKKIYVGLGGSATCDGGVGFIWKLACHSGQCLADVCEPRVAIDLAECAVPDIQRICDWLGDCELVACCDVDNPLLGERGAAMVFAPQKGATPEQTQQIEAWMGCWSHRMERHLGRALNELPGAGAAGGLGFAIAALGGTLLPGAKAVAELLGLGGVIGPDSVVFTTEGYFDETSFSGKAPWTVAEMARKAGAEAVIFCGAADDAAVRRAESASVQVVQFARGIPEDRRRTESADLLTRAVSDFLTLETERA